MTTETQFTLPRLRCRCGWEWTPRYERRPGVCPRCRSKRWDEPYRRAPKKPKSAAV